MAPAGVDEPVADLVDGEAGVLCECIFLFFSRIGMLNVLLEPASEIVRDMLGEIAAAPLGG